MKKNIYTSVYDYDDVCILQYSIPIEHNTWV